ncbi:hypothetical protein F5148DRAFT_1154766 [Russula earlei]|uniref:Uncharacterized protein n=1 Tax=Russula earlei TaxID=71964 RepID=A0ACC0TR19_9AGAM|nr:hypothetical protein F5148DRAFT_1154766 [Russula earlei]
MTVILKLELSATPTSLILGLALLVVWAHLGEMSFAGCMSLEVHLQEETIQLCIPTGQQRSLRAPACLRGTSMPLGTSVLPIQSMDDEDNNSSGNENGGKCKDDSNKGRDRVNNK